MIEAILPAAAVAVEARDDDSPTSLFPAEEAVVARAVGKRRREFAGGRECAHRALKRLGVPAAPILPGERGEPLWPDGVVGSITHCDGYRACAVAGAGDLAAIGIDAEPHRPLPQGLLADLAGPAEREHLGELGRAIPAIHWDKLLFSAKEAVYKAWFPLTGRWLGFEDAVLAIDPGERTFAARLLVAGPAVGGRQLGEFEGRWLVREGLVVSAVALSA